MATNPPVYPGPFIEAWPDPNNPQIMRPSGANAPYVGAVSGVVPVMSAGGGNGMQVPQSAPPIYDLARYCVLNGSRSYSIGTVSGKIIDSPPTRRNFLYFRNASGAASTTNIYVDFGVDARIDGIGIGGSILRLAPNEQMLCDAGIPQDDIYAIADAAGGLLVVAYGVIQLPS